MDQRGLRKSVSCESQTLALQPDLINAQQTREQVTYAAAKAFQVLDHFITESEHNYPISKSSKMDTENKIGDKLSDEIKVTSGLAHGSLLGHLLFLTYVNDLPTAQIRLFADVIQKNIKND